MVYIICMLIAVIAAFIGSLIGLGGGIVLIPSLIFMHHFTDAFEWATPQVIVGISLVTMVFTAMSSTVSYFKKGRVDYKTGMLFLTGSIPGGIFGSWLNQYVEMESFSLYFGILTIAISMLFLIKRKPGKTVKDESKGRTFMLEGENHYYNVSVFPAFIISLVVGLISGLFGIGGGSIMVPAMIILFGIPIHIATATSMFMIFFISVISAGTHVYLGHIIWEYAIFFIPGAWIGGTLGAKVNQMIKGNKLEWLLRVVLVVIGLRLIIEGMI
ncbi:sulfite exporter TauE/SafE family protein [Virgibacillus kekensis]|uniref:Probable membrane transporter protein n=1 Tax=Virgibacillus kekensis TaxID=202261 RepID=A0ABV9DIV3_9BACI